MTYKYRHTEIREISKELSEMSDDELRAILNYYVEQLSKIDIAPSSFNPKCFITDDKIKLHQRLLNEENEVQFELKRRHAQHVLSYGASGVRV